MEDKEQMDAKSALLSVAHGGQYYGTPIPELGTALVKRGFMSTKESGIE